jgi:hypothetical protein
MSVIIGIDPSTLGYNQICFMDGDLKVLFETKVEGHQETIAAIAEWIKKRRKSHKEKDFKLGIEFQRNILELAVKELNIPVFSVNATQLKKFIESTKMTRTKTDRLDAAMVCKYLAMHGLALKPYEPVSALRADARAIGTKLTNIRQKRTLGWQVFWSQMNQFAPRLRHLMKDKVRCKWFLDLILGPFAKKGFQRMQVDELASVCKSYTLKDKRVLGELLKELKLLHQNDLRAAYMVDAAKEMALINEQDKAWRKRAEQVCQCWEAYPYLMSVPAMTALTMVRLLAEFGEDWHIYSVSQLCAFAGVAPEVASSGTPPRERWKSMTRQEQARYKPKVYMRRACNRELRTVLCLHAICTVRNGWAKEQYRKSIALNQKHWTVLRKLSLQWLRIMYALVTKKEMYDEEKRERMRRTWHEEEQRRKA